MSSETKQKPAAHGAPSNDRATRRQPGKWGFYPKIRELLTSFSWDVLGFLGQGRGVPGTLNTEGKEPCPSKGAIDGTRT